MVSGYRVCQDLGDKLVDATLGMRIQTAVYEYRVSKYNPAFRDQSGAYTKLEWTFFRQIGQTFSGLLLTSDEYERVEKAYIQAALSFLRESGLLSMRVAGLQDSRKQPPNFQNDSVLPLELLDEIIRQILREEYWCRLEASDGFLHFGWDYYSVPHPCPIHEQWRPNSAYMSRNLPLRTSKVRLSPDRSGELNGSTQHQA